MVQLKWGIIGTSLVAYEVSYAIKYVKNNQIVAVLSKKKENAELFAKKFGLPRSYENLNDFFENPEINIVYIAAPTYLHFDLIKKCFEKGKHVLCEKPICARSQEAVEIEKLSIKRNLFCMEANWIIFNPAIQKLSSYVKNGKIGDIRNMAGSFGHMIHKIKNPETDQGVLLNLGVYLISVCINLIGRPDKVYGFEELDKGQSAFILKYNNNITAIFSCSHISDLKNEITVAGTKGLMTVKNPFYRSGFIEFKQSPFALNTEVMITSRNYYNYPLLLKYAPFIKRIYEKITIKSLATPFIGNSYHYQIKEVTDCIIHGVIKSKKHPIGNSIAALKVIESIKKNSNQIC